MTIVLNKAIIEELIRTNKLRILKKYQSDKINCNYYFTPNIGIKIYKPKVMIVNEKYIVFEFDKNNSIGLYSLLRKINEENSINCCHDGICIILVRRWRWSATATTNVARLDGFSKQIAKKYPGIKIVDKAYSQSQPAKANTNVSNWLTKYPKLAGIFAIDGTNAAGAAAAIQAKGLKGKVALVGYDAYKANVDLIGKGVFTALVAQDPAAEAKLAIEYLVKYFAGQTSGIKKEVVIPNVVLSKSSSKADLAKYTYVQK